MPDRDPSDDSLALIRRELIRVANRHNMPADRVSRFMISTVRTYEFDFLLQRAAEKNLEFTYGAYLTSTGESDRVET